MRKLFPVLAEQNARKEMDFLLSVCRSPWGIRGAMNLVHQRGQRQRCKL